MASRASRALVLFARALRLRCPDCGQGRPFTSWLRMRQRCPVRGLKTERGLMILAPFAFSPFSKTLFLAFDLVFRPAAHDALAPGVADAPRAR